MANNRVYLRCTCGESVFLAKCMSDWNGYYRIDVYGYGSVYEHIGKVFIKFMDKHFNCGPIGTYLETGHSTAIDLAFEHHHDKEREIKWTD
jgi:hypothetical protein